LGKQFAGFKLDHAANLNDRGSQEQARMQVKSEADPKSEKDGHPKRHPHNPPMSAVDSRINQETAHCARTRSDDYRRAPPVPPHATIHQAGWATSLRRSYITDLAFASDRIARMMSSAPQPSTPPPFAPNDPAGVHLFVNSGSAFHFVTL